ncbi:MAG: hypothetical protein HQM15_04025 [Deltaproteobacteria bacterium]|nr:hypothetical protein [Deltaproteobacteria bacterium]
MNKKTFTFLLLMFLAPALLWASEEAHGGHVNYYKEVLFPYINFFILFFILFLAAKKPIKDFFLTRSKEIAASLDQAAHEKQEVLTRYQQQENRLQNIEKEVLELKANFKQQGELARKKLIEESKANAKSIQEMSSRLADQELLRVKEFLREESVNSVLAGASKVVKKQFNAQDQARLFENNLERLEVFK